jgi:hypothetical protein
VYPGGEGYSEGSVDFEPEGVPRVTPPHVEVNLYSTVIHNYRFFYYLANEMTYLAHKEAARDDAGALDEYRYSIASVIFSFTYVEGYVHHLMYAPDSTEQALFSGMSKELKRSLERLSLPERIEYLAFHHPRSKTANPVKGREPYQSFILLTQLRNLLIHYKPKEEVTLPSSEDYQKAFEEYDKKVRANFAFNERTQGEGFLYRCFSKDCARWAFKVSREFTDWLSDALSVEKPHLHTPWALRDDSQ